MTLSHTRWLAVWLAAVVLVPVSAAAAPKVAPLTPVMKPSKANEILVRFHDALAQGLTSGGVTVVPAKTVRGKAKRACAATTCARSLSGRLGAENAAVCRIDTVGKNYRFQMKMISKSGTLATVSGRCDICTLMEALKTTRELSAKLARQGGLKAAAATKPPDKTGTKPPDKTGTKPPDKTGAKPPDKTQKPTGKTADGSKPAAPATSGQRWPLWPTLAAAGVGVLGLAVGIPLLSMDGDPTNCRGEPRPDGRNCSDVYSTSGAGWAMTTIGIAGLATAGVLAYLYFTSGKREKASAWLRGERTVAVTPLQGGLMLGAGGSF
jgi:hypothetical protein